MADIDREREQRLRLAVADPVVVKNYWARIAQGADDECWLWIGPISEQGVGRFVYAILNPGEAGHEPASQAHTAHQSMAQKRLFVAAHRFGFALAYGFDELLATPVVDHRCGKILCQNPRCLHKSDHRRVNNKHAAQKKAVGRPLSGDPTQRQISAEMRSKTLSGLPVEEDSQNGQLSLFEI